MKKVILITAMLIAFVNCNDKEEEQTPIAKIIAASNSPADGGTPTISDLKAIGLTGVRDDLQMPYEEAIALKNEKNVLTTLEQLQVIITRVNAQVDILPETSIVGTWQLAESFTHPPTGNGWGQMENGYILTIKQDGSFNSSQFSECSTGIATVETSQIILKYDCSGFSANFENPAGTFKYSFELIQKNLELTPQNFICFEGCKYRFVKIQSK